jgi:hypothetical protein
VRIGNGFSWIVWRLREKHYGFEMMKEKVKIDSMESEENKNEGPTCACGKGDLYEEWLKLQENKNEEASDPTSTNPAVNDSSGDVAGKDTQK